jgi:hypothetical protein
MPANDTLRTVSATIASPPEDCWRVLTNADMLVAWLPGVRRISVVARDAMGLPAEVQFEFAGSRSYSLLYSYDHSKREMRWEPRMGKRDAVRGFAHVEPVDAETRLTYGIEQGAARQGAELELGDPASIVAAFAAFMASRTRRAR